MTLTQDDMIFSPYMGISEVWYPDEDAPTPYQTADDIWSYIKLVS